MMGPKKLGTIRQDLRRALAATGQDPIRWLDSRMAAPKQSGIVASGQDEVLRSLRRLLRTSRASGPVRKPVVAKTASHSGH